MGDRAQPGCAVNHQGAAILLPDFLDGAMNERRHDRGRERRLGQCHDAGREKQTERTKRAHAQQCFEDKASIETPSEGAEVARQMFGGDHPILASKQSTSALPSRQRQRR
jgi:hypothetical protein